MQDSTESLEGRVSRVEGQMVHVTSIVEKMDRKLDSIAQGGRFTWQTFGVIFAMVVAIAGGGAFFVSMSIQPIAEATQISIRDRDDLRRLISAVSEKEVEGSKKDAAFGAQLVELETQVAKIYGDMNAQHSQAMSDISRIWTKTYGEPYPTIVYYPQPRILYHQ